MRQKGFTLIELLIVIVIIGILASIAIPNYLNMQKKAKTSEAKVNLGAIWHLQEAFRAENDRYIDTPAVGYNGFHRWMDHPGLFAQGTSRYTYDMTTANPSAFTCSAYGDLDGDPTIDAWTINQDGMLRQVSID